LLAVGKVRERQYDIILMDLQMPVLDGYSATKHIREFNKEIPIIALTASASTDIQQKTRESGMDDYLSKPFKPNDLFDTIYKHIRRLRKAS
jgi:CheY-like chemotaxis protein